MVSLPERFVLIFGQLSSVVVLMDGVDVQHSEMSKYAGCELVSWYRLGQWVKGTEMQRLGLLIDKICCLSICKNHSCGPQMTSSSLITETMTDQGHLAENAAQL